MPTSKNYIPLAYASGKIETLFKNVLMHRIAPDIQTLHRIRGNIQEILNGIILVLHVREKASELEGFRDLEIVYVKERLLSVFHKLDFAKDCKEYQDIKTTIAEAGIELGKVFDDIRIRLNRIARYRFRASVA